MSQRWGISSRLLFSRGGVKCSTAGLCAGFYFLYRMNTLTSMYLKRLCVLQDHPLVCAVDASWCNPPRTSSFLSQIAKHMGVATVRYFFCTAETSPIWIICHHWEDVPWTQQPCISFPASCLHAAYPLSYYVTGFPSISARLPTFWHLHKRSLDLGCVPDEQEIQLLIYIHNCCTFSHIRLWNPACCVAFNFCYRSSQNSNMHSRQMVNY